MKEYKEGGRISDNRQTTFGNRSANVSNFSEIDKYRLTEEVERDSKACLTNPLSILKRELSPKSNIQIVNNEVYFALTETPLTMREIIKQLGISRRTAKYILNQLIIDGLCASFHVAPRTPMLYTCNFRLMEYLKEGGRND